MPLSPDRVAAFVFWSKSYRPLIPHLKTIAGLGYYFYFHFTITGLPVEMEGGVVSSYEAVRQFKEIATIFTPGHIQWRFDPIVITDATGPEHHLRAFRGIASALEGFTTRCYLSFVELYLKVRRSLASRGIQLLELDADARVELALQLARIGADHGIRLYACCNDYLVTDGISKARCVDPEILSLVSPYKVADPAPSPTRRSCGCMRSVDIGTYDTCRFRCIYCYAISHR